jgi:hypothetical protein
MAVRSELMWELNSGVSDTAQRSVRHCSAATLAQVVIACSLWLGGDDSCQHVLVTSVHIEKVELVMLTWLKKFAKS